MKRNNPHRSAGALGTASAPFSLAALTAVCAFAAFSASPAAAQSSRASGPCEGRWVSRLGGPQAVTATAIPDVASLTRRLPELEASIRKVIGDDPKLGPAVAEATIAAIRNGAGITERPMQRGEDVQWMAYQPTPGRYGVIAPPCLRLNRTYQAFEIMVDVPEPAATAATPACAVTAQRGCMPEHPNFAVDIRGSSPGARVTLTMGDRPPAEVGGPEESWNVDDPDPYDLDAVFTVRAAGEPMPPRTARVFRFLIPKICGNLAYLGELPRKTISPAGAVATCEKSVRVAPCAAATTTAPPPPYEPPAEIAESCPRWIARPFLFGFSPTGSEQRRDIFPPEGPAWERFSLGDGYGLGGSLERRYGRVVGLEGALFFGRSDAEYKVSDGVVVTSDSRKEDFYAVTIGPNFHFSECGGGTDFYFGPFVGYGGFSGSDHRSAGHRFTADSEHRFLWGAQVGLDIPFGAQNPWGFHGGVRYFDLSRDTDAGSIQIDPLLAEIGLFYRF